MNDDELISLSLSGDRSAYEKLVLTYQDRLFNAMIRIAGTPEDALDVVQEAFLQAFLRLSTFRRTSQFYTWLYRIGFNIALGFRRKKKKQLSLDVFLSENGAEPLAEVTAPLEHVGNAEMAKILWKTIDNLHEDYRSVVVLREIEGNSYDEIAEILELPIGTVRSRLHRARNILKDVLQRYERDF